MNYICEIIDNLYIGPISVVYSKEKIHFDVIVNCTKDDYDYIKITNNYYQIPVDDTKHPDNINTFVKYAIDILPKITEHYKNNKTIFVHCSQGVQRSAAFVAILLVFCKNITLEEAIKLVLLKKPNCFSHGREVNFIESLNRIVSLNEATA